jgi:hypothetical protein
LAQDALIITAQLECKHTIFEIEEEITLKSSKKQKKTKLNGIKAGQT